LHLPLFLSHILRCPLLLRGLNIARIRIYVAIHPADVAALHFTNHPQVDLPTIFARYLSTIDRLITDHVNGS